MRETRRWCRGKTGDAHKTETVKEAWAAEIPCSPRTFGCFHSEECVNCGRRIRYLDSKECPDLIK